MFSKLLNKALNVTVDNQKEIEYQLANEIAFKMTLDYIQTVKPIVTTLCDNWWVDSIIMSCKEVLQFLGIIQYPYILREVTRTIKGLSDDYIAHYATYQ